MVFLEITIIALFVVGILVALYFYQKKNIAIGGDCSIGLNCQGYDPFGDGNSPGCCQGKCAQRVSGGCVTTTTTTQPPSTTDSGTLPSDTIDSGTASETGEMLTDGVYRIYQVSTKQYLDMSTSDTSLPIQVVTRPYDVNSMTQKWIIKKEGTTGNVRILHVAPSLFLDAYETYEQAGKVVDHNVVLQIGQANDSQVWKFTVGAPGASPANWYIQQLNTLRYLDAYEGTNDNRVVTRPLQANTSQQWVLVPSNITPGQP